MKTCIFTLSVALLFITAGLIDAAFAGYKGFQQINPSSCQSLDKKTRGKLPADYLPYAPFAKICPLREKPGKAANVAIIAIWVEDYYAGKPEDANWQAFPKPIIIDQQFCRIGELPELYPVDEPRELDVYYGVWKSGRPTEILVDVYNPAVSGNYYYPPLLYDNESGKYQMRSQEVSYGRRRR